MKIEFKNLSRGYSSWQTDLYLTIMQDRSSDEEWFAECVDVFKSMTDNIEQDILVVDKGLLDMSTGNRRKWLGIKFEGIKCTYLPRRLVELFKEHNSSSRAALVDIEYHITSKHFVEQNPKLSFIIQQEEWYVPPETCMVCFSEAENIKTYKIGNADVKLCPQCYKSKVARCPICGEYHYRANMHIIDGRLCCDKCIENIKKRYKKSVYWCEYCKEYHTQQRYGKQRVNETGWVCDIGAQFCSKCNCCGMLMYNVHSFTSFNRQHYCSKCWQMKEKYLIKSYHNNPIPEFYDIGKDGKNKQIASPLNGIGNFYGVELEVDSGGQRDDISEPTIKLLNEEVYAMRDGSLTNGFEIVTHPHTEQALYNMNWEETFKYLVKEGYRSHDINTCGLHLHCNRHIFGSTKTEISINVAKLMYFFEEFRKDFIKLSRREVQHINRWARFYFDTTGKDLNDYFAVYNNFNRSGVHDHRYKAINLCKANTIEFRLMRGTLNIDTFMATLNLLITISKNAKRIKAEDAKKPEMWLDGITDATRQYLKDNDVFVEYLDKKATGFKKEGEEEEIKSKQKTMSDLLSEVSYRPMFFNTSDVVSMWVDDSPTNEEVILENEEEGEDE